MKRWSKYLLLLMAVLFLCGCGKKEKKDDTGYKIWYMNKEETKLDYECEPVNQQNPKDAVAMMLNLLREQPKDEELKSVLPEKVSVLDYHMEHNQLYVNFTETYLEMPKVYEVLCRAAIVRTLCQIPEIDYVGFRVEREPLKDLNRINIGLMNEDRFIESAGEESDGYRTADLTLYYANKSGDKLKTQRVAMEYNSNIPLEKIILQQLISGPPFEGVYPTIPPETKLISLVVKDNTCFVNLDQGFLADGYDVLEAIPIYSIVNSLIANTPAKRVQISIEGETDLIYKESIDFSEPFRKNEALVE